MSNSLRGDKPSLLWPLLLGIAVVVLYAPLAGADFILYDDNVYLLSNEHVKTGFTVDGIKWAFTTGFASNWHPLTWMSHMVDVSLFGLNPACHHMVNVFIHAFATVVLFVVLVRMTAAQSQSFFVAAAFGLHPLHVQSVAWISERKDVLSTLFGFIAIGFYVSWIKDKTFSNKILLLFFFACSLMSKPMLVTLPLLFLLLDAWPLDRLGNGLLPLIREKASLFFLSFATGVITIYVQSAGGAVRSMNEVPIYARFVNAAISICKYLYLTVYPHSLAFFYPNDVRSVSIGLGLLCAALCILFSLGVIRKFPERPYLLVGWFWFLISISPVLGILQVGDHSMADRFTYVPIIGVFVALSWYAVDLVQAFGRYSTILKMTSVVLLVCWCACTRFELQFWMDSDHLFRRAIQVTDGNYVAHHNLGSYLYCQGNTQEAIEHWRCALRIKPQLIETRIALAKVLLKKGELDQALVLAQQAVKMRKDFTAARLVLAKILYRQKDYSAALYNLCRVALAANRSRSVFDSIKLAANKYTAGYPVRPPELTSNYIGDTGKKYATLDRLLHDGKYSAARKLLWLELKKPGAKTSLIFNNLGVILALQKKYSEALVYFAKALSIEPGYKRAMQFYMHAYQDSRKLVE